MDWLPTVGIAVPCLTPNWGVAPMGRDTNTSPVICKVNLCWPLAPTDDLDVKRPVVRTGDHYDTLHHG